MKRIISWLLVIIWIIIIFIFSSMNSYESNKKSEETINNVIEKTINKSNNIGLTNKHISDSKMKSIVSKLNIPFRKLMHVLEYFILNILLLNAFHFDINNNKKLYIICLIISIFLALFDEIHQLYSGRSGKVLDVFIDTIGILFGSLLYYLKNKRNVI